ncbi:hypothetical protein HanRHA438_Chr02g0088211 [Helianthus annuus]|nr:hypothetical protein HanRHA438_Chr02g0088211 [Helianthus annuus]
MIKKNEEEYFYCQPVPLPDKGVVGSAPASSRPPLSNSFINSGSTFSSGSQVPSSKSVHFTKYSFFPSSPSRLPITHSATAYSNPSSKSLTKSSAINAALTHSLSSPSFHFTKYSRFFPFPLFSIISSTSAYSNIEPSNTLITLSNPNLLANCTGFPLGVEFKTSRAKSNGVRPRSSPASGSAPNSTNSFATPGLTYPAAICNAVKPPTLSLWFTSAPASTKTLTHDSDPNPATNSSAVRPSPSTASTSRPSPELIISFSARSSAFLAATHHGFSYSATTSAAIKFPGTHVGAWSSSHSIKYSIPARESIALLPMIALTSP